MDTIKKDNRPPGILIWILKLTSDASFHAPVSGDIEEIYSIYCRNRGKLRTLVWLLKQIIRSLPLFISNKIYRSAIMFKNYIRISLRNLIRHKGYSFLNISGLTIGMMCFLLIVLYAQYEMNFDRFHEKYENIYRVIRKYPGDTNFVGGTPAPLGPTLVQDFPEVIDATRIGNVAGALNYNNRRFVETGLFADEQFFDLFSFSLKRGDENTALNEPFSVLLSEELAERLFGDEDPVGKIINYYKQYDEDRYNPNASYDLTVKGILDDVPDNSHFQFDYLISFITIGSLEGSDRRYKTFSMSHYYNYVELLPGFACEELNEKLPEFTSKYRSRGRRTVESYFLQPLKEVHLGDHVRDELPGNSINGISLYMLVSVAFIILIIACINYMNLSTARSSKRAKEIGIRKVIGAQRFQLLRQFLGESLLYTTISLMFAVVLVVTVLPFFNNFIERNIEFNVLENGFLLKSLFGIVLFVGLFSGCYPALLLSSFKPVKALYSTVFSASKGINLRNFLVVSQFCISVFLIASTFVVFGQLDYIRNKDLGYNREQVVVIPLHDEEARSKVSLIKEAVILNPGVAGVSSTPYYPTTMGNRNYVEITNDKGEKVNIGAIECLIDHEFIDVFEMELISGRNFSKENTNDKKQTVILNESFAKMTGWANPVGKFFPLTGLDKSTRVIGVVKDFHDSSLHNEITPLVLMISNENYSYLSVKIQPGNIPQTVEFLKTTLERYSPNHPFEYHFFDEYFDSKYKSEEKFGTVFGFFSGIAVFIACLGILGLASYTAERRSKEIGIRKVHGASVRALVRLLLNEFLVLVIYANIAAWPLAYFFMDKWLQEFAYKISIGIDVFLAAGTLALIIAFLTVGFQAFKTAVANPIESLRCE
ncbi:MAG: FtsX-like permease family protein [bacterium]|nr:FtsX-like permease family protein [bacterium]